jgi:hypothetical protein
MLLRCRPKAQGLSLRVYRADAAIEGWGEGFDLVVLAGNLLINIETQMDYKAAQALFVQKAAKARRRAGTSIWTLTCTQTPRPSSIA